MLISANIVATINLIDFFSKEEIETMIDQEIERWGFGEPDGADTLYLSDLLNYQILEGRISLSDFTYEHIYSCELADTCDDGFKSKEELKKALIDCMKNTTDVDD